MSEAQQIVAEAMAALSQANSVDQVREVENRFLGKSGLISTLFKQLGNVRETDKKREFGRAANAARAEIERAVQIRFVDLKSSEDAERFQRELIDVSLPGRRSCAGIEHVLQQTENRIMRVLGGLGFRYVVGPEIETFRYNFEKLNYPPDHPAMDEQDTFYLEGDRLLRTQCTALQGRIFERETPPLRIFTIGRTYRNEAVDRTHGHTFNQVDCFMVDEGVSMAHLKGTLGVFARSMFGPEVKVRFRPDFFPFVEPGVDYAISTPKLFDGRWVELGGAGLIHPRILEEHGFDSERFSGFAFGLGVERIPMMAYGVDDLRLFFENDLRFLRQFANEPLW